MSEPILIDDTPEGDALIDALVVFAETVESRPMPTEEAA